MAKRRINCPNCGKPAPSQGHPLLMCSQDVIVIAEPVEEVGVFSTECVDAVPVPKEAKEASEPIDRSRQARWDERNADRMKEWRREYMRKRRAK